MGLHKIVWVCSKLSTDSTKYEIIKKFGGKKS
jgi:hypothetical protein